MNNSPRERRQEMPRWNERGDMVRQALSQSLPWFAFVNISFALLIALRNRLFIDFDDHVLSHNALIPFVERGIYLVIAASLLLILVGWLSAKQPSISLQGLGLTLVAVLSLIWAFSCYCFVVFWHLPIAYPLGTILLLTAMAALYFYPQALLTYVLPLWLSLPLASYQLNNGMNTRFALIWLILTLILLYGRYMLMRWFNEAWWRYEQNQLLISRLDMLAHQDGLTATANRRALENHLREAMTQQRPFSLIMLDVDYFKRYNDHYGHQAGDECLTAVAAVLKESVRTPEDVVGRYGGEEFVVVLLDASTDEAERVAARIQQRLQQRALAHAASEVSAQVTVSMGIASTTSDCSAEQLIAHADEALYRAKRQGRNRWSF
nr:membrane-associated sensor domain-containing protein [Pantoea cypripedii]